MRSDSLRENNCDVSIYRTSPSPPGMAWQEKDPPQGHGDSTAFKLTTWPSSWYEILATWNPLCFSCHLVAKLCMSDSLQPHMDCSLPDSSVHGISQARILEWVAISFPKGSSWPRDQTHISCIAGRFFTLWALGSQMEGELSFPFSGNELMSFSMTLLDGGPVDFLQFYPHTGVQS